MKWSLNSDSCFGFRVLESARTLKKCINLQASCNRRKGMEIVGCGVDHRFQGAVLADAGGHKTFE